MQCVMILFQGKPFSIQRSGIQDFSLEGGGIIAYGNVLKLVAEVWGHAPPKENIEIYDL